MRLSRKIKVGIWKKLLFLGICVFSFCFPNSAKSQAQPFDVVIGLPNQGETFYAGPSSLIYNIPVSGWIVGYETDPSKINLVIEIIKGGIVIDKLEGNPFRDGTFEFKVTVNPHHAWGHFDRVDGAYDPTKLSCGECCHHPTNINLQPGKITIRVTATNLRGAEAISERNITVDISDYAIVPVQLMIEGEANKNLEGISVVATTRLYLWRSRHFQGTTDANGFVELRVESLSEAPTQYQFQVEPVIVNGVLFESKQPQNLILLPGATKGEIIYLNLKASSGNLSGNIIRNDIQEDQELDVYAISIPDGSHRVTPTDSQGFFTFSNIPVGEYIVISNNKEDLNKTLYSEQEYINLTNDIGPSIQLDVYKENGTTLSGSIKGIDKKPIPFAWISDSLETKVSQVIPNSGEYHLANLQSNEVDIVVNAPGYYSLAKKISFENSKAMLLDLTLKIKPKTQQLIWGSGSLIIPEESLVEISEKSIFLSKGWLWANGYGENDLLINTPTANIIIQEGNFAIEVNNGNESWFYLFEGEATVSPKDNSQEILIYSNQMVNLNNKNGLIPVPYNSIVVDALRQKEYMPLEPSWEPTLSSTINNQLTKLSVGSAQIFTTITTIIILFLIVFSPLLIIYFWRRKSNRHLQ